MATTHPYAQELAIRIGQRPNRTLKIKCRTLLKGFGYFRRTEGIIARTTEQLKACGLVATLSTDFPRSLDDRITITVGDRPDGSPLHGGPKTRGPIPEPEPDVAERAVAATVEIATDGSLGSGFIVHPDGLVVTARHVVNSEDGLSERSVKVRLADERVLGGTVFRSHRQLDFALIWLPAEGPFPSLPVGNPRTLRYRQRMLAVGSPSGLPRTVSEGIVSNPAQRFNHVECVQTDAGIDFGNSGGPLVTSSAGEVVGIVVWGLGQADNAKFAVPIDYLAEELREALRQGRQQCLSAGYCPACGYAEYGQPTWYCRNCGAQFTPSQPGSEA